MRNKQPVDFITLPEDIRDLDLSKTQELEGLLNIQFSFNLNLMEHYREIYGPLDFLGDLGGFSDALFGIGYILVSLFYFIDGNPLV